VRHVETFTCEGCGKVFTSRNKNARFCSRTCANRNYEKKKYEGREKVDKSKAPRCPNNKWVVCYEQTNCANCGWNPAVAERRAKKSMGGA
jgi:hypothetical protein